MTDQEFQELLEKGITAADQGHTLVALLHLEDAARRGSTPILASYLGYCLARERQQFKKGMGLCLEALKQEPEQLVHYLNLGRIYLAAGDKVLAIKTFRQSLKLGRHRLILEELKTLGTRKPPVVPSLSRSHPLNKYLGLLFARLAMR